MTDDQGWPNPPHQTPNGTAAWSKPADNVGNATPPSPPPANPMARIRLNTVGDVAKELRKLYRESRAGKLSVKEATSLAYLLNMLAGILTASDLEDRLSNLEKRK